MLIQLITEHFVSVLGTPHSYIRTTTQLLLHYLITSWRIETYYLSL
nr:MAG TPA: hypothetical protein [Crassvirales sp.]